MPSVLLSLKGCSYRIVSVSSNDTAAKRLTLNTVMRFLITGGHETTPEVPGAGISGWRLKLSDASPEIMIFLPKTVSTVISKRQTERRIKLKSALIFSGTEKLALGAPGGYVVVSPVIFSREQFIRHAGILYLKMG